jgi:hypothetical protein
MQDAQKYQRPPFEEAIKEWKRLLTVAGLPTECEWILDENLVFEKDAATEAGVRLSFQTQFTVRPADLAQLTYDFFTDFEARMVFYRLGTSNGKSVCLLLCDSVFETRGSTDGFVRRDEWLISFHPGDKGEIEEVTDGQRWKNRLVSGRPLMDVDFCMPLVVLRELEVHGRALTPPERFGVKMVDAWQRWQRASGE